MLAATLDMRVFLELTLEHFFMRSAIPFAAPVFLAVGQDGSQLIAAAESKLLTSLDGLDGRELQTRGAENGSLHAILHSPPEPGCHRADVLEGQRQSTKIDFGKTETD